MISYDAAKVVCETYIQALVDGELDKVLGLFDDSATVEDPVGTEIKAGKDDLREFYTVACQSVTAGHLTGEPKLAGDELAFPFKINVGSGDQAMSIDIIDVFRFNSAGKVVAMRAFWCKENMGPAI